MKVSGFTITEISVNMLISGLIIIFIISFISFQNRVLLNQIKNFDRTSDLRLLQSVLSQNFSKSSLIMGNGNSICFRDYTSPCNQEISFYPDSIIIHQPSPNTFQFKNQTDLLFLRDSIISQIDILIYDEDQQYQLTYRKTYTEGELLNIQP